MLPSFDLPQVSGSFYAQKILPFIRSHSAQPAMFPRPAIMTEMGNLMRQFSGQQIRTGIYIRSAAGILVQQFGISGDKALPNAYVP
jgi:hypothetical protein